MNITTNIKNKTLNHSIIRLIVSLLLLSTIVTLITTWISTTNHVTQQLIDKLTVGESVFEQILTSRETLLLNSTEVLTNDFGFKQAVATSEQATIKSALINHGSRINADLMALFDLDGELIAQSKDLINSSEYRLSKETIEQIVNNGGLSSFLEQDGKIYQVIILTVNTPAPAAFAFVGFKLDSQFAVQFKNIANLELLIKKQTLQGENIQLTTLNSQSIKQFMPVNINNLKINKFTLPLKSQSYYATSSVNFTAFETAGLQVILADNIQQTFMDFNYLQLQISLIALIVILLAILVGIMFAKNLTTPLQRLVLIAQKIAKGDYQNSLIIENSSAEIRNLSDTFSLMMKNIKAREAKIKHQASHDLLTGLLNRYELENQLNIFYQSTTEFITVGIKIIQFKALNDTFGADAVDQCLTQLAHSINQYEGVKARINNDEFVFASTKKITRLQLEEMRIELEKPLMIEAASIKITLFFAVLNLPKDADNTKDLLRRLSITLGDVKAENTGIALYKAEKETEYLKRLEILTELRNVLTHSPEQLDVFYQPKLNLRTKQIEKAEALIRWFSPKLGFVPPDVFISIAEQAGNISDITDLVLDKVSNDSLMLRSLNIQIQIAVNLSVQDIITSRLTDKIKHLADRDKTDYRHLSFELTESGLMNDPQTAINQLKLIRQKGFDIAIDDFGTGYSSLTYLKNLPITELKVDRSFVMKLHTQPADQIIVKNVIALAVDFGLDVVAEGVEDIESLILLNNWNIKWIQGYFIAKPMKFDDLADWIKQFKCPVI